MKKLIIDLSRNIENLSKIIHRREEAFDNMSPKWKASEKGDSHQFKTNEMKSQYFLLEEIKDELESL